VTQNTMAARIARYLREHPGSSTWEMAVDLHIANITARMSDLRAEGYDFTKWRDDKGVWRYRIVEPDLTLGLS
jgi:threonine aldolase